jgi:hypothetical protein
MWRTLLILLLTVVAVLVPVATASAATGLIGDDGGWFQWIFDAIQEWVQGMFCRFRVAAFNAIGKWFCVECSVSVTAPGEIPDDDDPGGGGGGSGTCHDIPDCECALCPGWLSDYKDLVAEGVSWIIGAGNFLSKFIPWQLWATLYVAYLNVIVLMWVIRLVTKFGMMFFGRVM